MMNLIAFLEALPELIRLFQVLAERISEAQLDRKVKDDLKTLHEAFEDRDEKKLNALFNTPAK